MGGFPGSPLLFSPRCQPWPFPPLSSLHTRLNPSVDTRAQSCVPSGLLYGRVGACAVALVLAVCLYVSARFSTRDREVASERESESESESERDRLWEGGREGG